MEITERLEKLVEELKQNLPPIPDKKGFFKKNFPEIEDCTNWKIIIPESMNKENLTSNIEWIHFSQYVNEITALRKPHEPMFLPIMQPMS